MAFPKELQSMQSRGWATNDRGAYDLNLIGVRVPRTHTRRTPFTDELYVIYRNEQSTWIRESFDLCTDATARCTDQALRVRGTAIMIPGQYRDLWVAGRHNGRIALVQKRPCRVWRDANQHDHIDWDPEDSKLTGYYPMDLHDAWEHTVYAGCQMLRTQLAIQRIRALLELQVAYGHGVGITYTLAQHKDLYS